MPAYDDTYLYRNMDPINAHVASDIKNAYLASKAKREEDDKVKEVMFSLTTLLSKPGIEKGHVYYTMAEGKWTVEIHVKPLNMVYYQIKISDDSLAKALTLANNGLDRYLSEEMSL